MSSQRISINTQDVENSKMQSVALGGRHTTKGKAFAMVNKIINNAKSLDVQRGKPIPDLDVKETIVPVSFATVLFLGWGFAYGLLDTMNAKVKGAMGLSQAEAALLAVAYYAAYVFIPFVVAGPIVRGCGYRHAFILGLLLFGIGNFVVSIGAKAVGTGGPAYPIMVLGIFVVGSGISTLERAANPYVTHVGPVKWSALRLNLTQSGAALGTVVAPLLAAKLIFEEQSVGVTTGIAKRAAEAKAMESVVGLYQATGSIVLGITLLLGVVFFRSTLVPEVPGDPHATEDEEISQKAAVGATKLQRFTKHPIWKENRLWWGVMANFFNLGCQVAVAQYFIPYCVESVGMSHTKAAHMLSVAQAAFLGGRVCMSILCRFFKERLTLLLFISGAIACTVATSVSPGAAGVVCTIFIMAFEAPLFPTIFATASIVHDQHSSLREDIMIASISGGAFLSPLVGKSADAISKFKPGKGVPLAFNVIAVAFSVVSTYIVAINLKGSYKKEIDNASGKDQSQLDMESGSATSLEELPSSTILSYKTSMKPSCESIQVEDIARPESAVLPLYQASRV